MKGVETGVISRIIDVQEGGSIWHAKEFGFHSGVMGAIHGAEGFKVEMQETSRQPGQ